MSKVVKNTIACALIVCCFFTFIPIASSLGSCDTNVAYAKNEHSSQYKSKYVGTKVITVYCNEKGKSLKKLDTIVKKAKKGTSITKVPSITKKGRNANRILVCKIIMTKKYKKSNGKFAGYHLDVNTICFKKAGPNTGWKKLVQHHQVWWSFKHTDWHKAIGQSFVNVYKTGKIGYFNGQTHFGAHTQLH